MTGFFELEFLFWDNCRFTCSCKESKERFNVCFTQFTPMETHCKSIVQYLFYNFYLVLFYTFYFFREVLIFHLENYGTVSLPGYWHWQPRYRTLMSPQGSLMIPFYSHTVSLSSHPFLNSLVMSRMFNKWNNIVCTFGIGIFSQHISLEILQIVACYQ